MSSNITVTDASFVKFIDQLPFVIDDRKAIECILNALLDSGLLDSGFREDITITDASFVKFIRQFPFEADNDAMKLILNTLLTSGLLNPTQEPKEQGYIVILDVCNKITPWIGMTCRNLKTITDYFTSRYDRTLESIVFQAQVEDGEDASGAVEMIHDLSQPTFGDGVLFEFNIANNKTNLTKIKKDFDMKGKCECLHQSIHFIVCKTGPFTKKACNEADESIN